jgi:methionine-rich copper-binding protein CopC
VSTLHRSTASVAAALLLVLALAAPALAHADLKSSDPEDKAVLATPPTTITLTFTEALDQAKSSFKLNGPAGTVGTGKPTRQGSKDMTLEGLVIAPGAYGIEWTSAATDGHLERGKLSFTVLEPTPVPATPSPTPAPSAASSAAASGAPSAASSGAPTAAASEAPASSGPAATAAPRPAGGDASSTAGSGADVLIPIAVGLVLVGGLGAFLLRRSRRA